MSEPYRYGPRVPTVGVQQASTVATDGSDAIILDVREPYEFDQVRVEGAVLVPLDQLGERLAELPRDRPLLVLCRTGVRSEEATAFLASRGFDNAANIKGGIVAWYNAGLPIKTGAPEPGEGELQSHPSSGPARG